MVVFPILVEGMVLKSPEGVYITSMAYVGTFLLH